MTSIRIQDILAVTNKLRLVLSCKNAIPVSILNRSFKLVGKSRQLIVSIWYANLRVLAIDCFSTTRTQLFNNRIYSDFT